MIELFLTMLERLGIIVMIAFVLTRFRFFRQMIYQDKLGRMQQMEGDRHVPFSTIYNIMI